MESKKFQSTSKYLLVNIPKLTAYLSEGKIITSWDTLTPIDTVKRSAQLRATEYDPHTPFVLLSVMEAFYLGEYDLKVGDKVKYIGVNQIGTIIVKSVITPDLLVVEWDLTGIVGKYVKSNLFRVL
jgi:hypothetical protein